MRSLFLLILVVIFYYFLKSIFTSNKNELSGKRKEPERIDDMVKDPFCETYVPKSTALSSLFDGERFYFCSEECLEKFKKKNSV